MMNVEELFERERVTLVRHAYRMLGTMTDAEDAVQDAFERIQRADAAKIRDARAYLRAVVTNLALDRLRSSSRTREVYVGPWLPEPVIDEQAVPEQIVTIAEDISFAFLLALERLSPLERAAFLMHDALDVPFAEIARTLGRSEESVRRLASRARSALQTQTPRRVTPPPDAQALRDRMGAAILSGDVGGLMQLLTADVTLLSDGGGKKTAAINPLVGPDRVARFLAGVSRKNAAHLREIVPTWINGLPGWALFGTEGLDQTVALEIEDGAVRGVYITRNPDKLSAARAALCRRA